MLKGKKLIEIRKAAFVNKGAELMFCAILEKMKQEFPDAKFVMETDRDAPYEKRALLGLYQKPRFFRFGVQLGECFRFFPEKFKDKLGIVDDKQVDVVLDAAGFAYSDQWGVRSSQELANSCKRWRKNGTIVILMPQAFGPFKNGCSQKYIKSVMDNADLVFAREKVSYGYLERVVGKRSNLRMAPDFTNLVEGVLPENFDSVNNRFCLVPNYRMVDKTSKEQSEAYLPFMIKCAKYLVEKGQKPFVLVHEGTNDLILAKAMNDAVGGCMSIIKETDPLKIKGILGACEGTVGSRFHGLVSALSQGVPTLATGWSHKYQMLFEEYGFSEGLLDVICSEEELYEKLDLLIQPSSKKQIEGTIKKNSEKLKLQSERMWNEVISIVAKKVVKST